MINHRYDVIVVGARCAGASTAMLLARAGLRVLVVDKSRYGSDTVSTHALMRGSALQLARWGLLDRVRDTGAPAVTAMSFYHGGRPMTLEITPRGGVDALFAPRRTVLDRLLVDAASGAGAEFLFGARVDDLVRDGEQVTGVSIHHDNKRHTILADWVVGADGADSTIARLAGAETTRASTRSIGCVLGYFEGLEIDNYHWFFNDGVGSGIIPTNGGHCLFMAVPQGELPASGSLEPLFATVFRKAALSHADSIAGATRVGGLRSFRGRLGYMRRASGPGWALVGDAGYFKDPITAHGITDALRDAELLARALIDGSRGALYEYEGIRDDLSRTFFDLTDTIASFEWTLPELAAMHYSLNGEMKREERFLASLEPIAGDSRASA